MKTAKKAKKSYGIKLEKMGKKTSFGPDFGPFGPNSGC